MDSPVCERSDDETWRVAQILVGIEKLGITDVSIAVPVPFIPTVAQLGQPYECLRVLHLREKEHRRRASLIPKL